MASKRVYVAVQVLSGNFNIVLLHHGVQLNSRCEPLCVDGDVSRCDLLCVDGGVNLCVLMAVSAYMYVC